MFYVIYQFHTHQGLEDEFCQSWKAMTELISNHSGGLGSRLHKSSKGEFIAYAKWPDRETWQSSSDKLPPQADEVRTQMRKCCSKVETLYELEALEDFIL